MHPPPPKSQRRSANTTPKIYHLYAHVLHQNASASLGGQRGGKGAEASSSSSKDGDFVETTNASNFNSECSSRPPPKTLPTSASAYNDLLLLEPNFWYLEKCARDFSSSSSPSSPSGSRRDEKEEDEDEEYSYDEEDEEDASKAAFKKLFGMMRESAPSSSSFSNGGATVAGTTTTLKALSSSASFKVRKCSPCAIAMFSRTILLSKLDQAETVPHTNVMQSTRVENGLKTLRGVVQALAKQSRKASGVDIVHWMTTTIGTIKSMNDSDAGTRSNKMNDTMTSTMTTTTSTREFAVLPSVYESNRFFNALILKCCDVLKSDVAHPKCKLEALKLLASLAKCKENIGSSCLFAYLVSDQKNGDAIFDAIVNNVLKNDILARNTLWQDACYVLAVLLSWNEGKNRVAARTARATDLEAAALLRAISFLLTKSGSVDEGHSNRNNNNSSSSRTRKSPQGNQAVTNFLTSGWMHVTKALGFVEDKLNGVSDALGARTKMFPNSDVDVCGALCIARDAKFMSAQPFVTSENDRLQKGGENGEKTSSSSSSSSPTIAHILDDDAALIGVSLMHGVLSNCVALRLPRAWIKKTSINASEMLHGVALGDHWRDALGSILVFAAALAREREIEKKKASSSIANNIRRIVSGTDGKCLSSSSLEAVGEARRKALATSVLCCFQRLVDDSASLEFLCALSCLDCARPLPGSTVSSSVSPLQSSSLTSSNGTGNADTHFISNLVSSKGLLNARVKLNRPFIAAMLETCSEIAKFGEYFGACVTSRAVYISHQIVSVKAANRSFVCGYAPSTTEEDGGRRRRREDESENENNTSSNNNTFKATGEGSSSLRANWSRTFDAIAVVLELCSKAHVAEAANPPAAKTINGASSPKREKQRNAGRANEEQAPPASSSLDEFKATRSAVAAQLVNLVNLFLAKPESSCDSIADVAELVETLVALCPKLTPLLNAVGQQTYGELRMQSIAFVYNALKSVNNNNNKTTTTPSSSSTKPNELNNNNNNKSVTTVRAVAEREINDGSMTRNVPVKDNLTAAFALRSGSFSSSFEKQQLQNQQQNDDDVAVLALIRAGAAAGR